MTSCVAPVYNAIWNRNSKYHIIDGVFIVPIELATKVRVSQTVQREIFMNCSRFVRHYSKLIGNTMLL